MSFCLEKRKELIQNLEEYLKSKVLIYYTSSRQPLNLFGGAVSTDTLSVLYEHLKGSNFDKISLFISTSGGGVDAPWPIVNLIRSFTDNFEVFIPTHSMSAGTLICLGANRIVMSPLSQLSPVDPEGHFEKDGKKYDIEVENIIGYIELAKEKLGLKDQRALEKVLEQLSSETPASLLGSINRTYSLIRRISENLLKLHIKDRSMKRINKIVQQFTSDLFSHRHFINRYEAKNLIGLGDIIKYASTKDEEMMNTVQRLYSIDILKEKSIFNIDEVKDNSLLVPAAIIDSSELLSDFLVNIIIDKKQMPFKINKQNIGWKNNGGNNV